MDIFLMNPILKGTLFLFIASVVLSFNCSNSRPCDCEPLTDYQSIISTSIERNFSFSPSVKFEVTRNKGDGTVKLEVDTKDNPAHREVTYQLKEDKMGNMLFQICTQWRLYIDRKQCTIISEKKNRMFLEDFYKILKDYSDTAVNPDDSIDEPKEEFIERENISTETVQGSNKIKRNSPDATLKVNKKFNQEECNTKMFHPSEYGWHRFFRVQKNGMTENPLNGGEYSLCLQRGDTVRLYLSELKFEIYIHE